jgi:hypothetical protein
LKNILIWALMLTAFASAFSQTDAQKTVRSSDPAIVQILSSLSHPTSAELQVNDITVSEAEQIHRVVFHFNLNGQSVKVVGGCSTFSQDSRHCGSLLWLGNMESLTCKGNRPVVCTTTGSGTFLIEKRKKKGYLVHPVEGGKANTHVEIPVTTIDDRVLLVE